MTANHHPIELIWQPEQVTRLRLLNWAQCPAPATRDSLAWQRPEHLRDVPADRRVHSVPVATTADGRRWEGQYESRNPIDFIACCDPAEPTRWFLGPAPGTYTLQPVRIGGGLVPDKEAWAHKSNRDDLDGDHRHTQASGAKLPGWLQASMQQQAARAKENRESTMPLGPGPAWLEGCGAHSVSRKSRTARNAKASGPAWIEDDDDDEGGTAAKFAKRQWTTPYADEPQSLGPRRRGSTTVALADVESSGESDDDNDALASVLEPELEADAAVWQAAERTQRQEQMPPCLDDGTVAVPHRPHFPNAAWPTQPTTPL